jgi:hypothetical protein
VESKGKCIYPVDRCCCTSPWKVNLRLHFHYPWITVPISPQLHQWIGGKKWYLDFLIIQFINYKGD